MKKAYEKPEMEIIVFEMEDILTTSGLGFDGAGFDDILDWEDITH
ncbi:hypothetical protein [Candidatus Formimonas warabiya]|nr:hypothetical protein [Candidatus Formimonas warabiya]